jgi:hypothetical protein
MSEQVNIHDAKTRLSSLIARAEAGEEIIIARAKKPSVLSQRSVRPFAGRAGPSLDFHATGFA